MALDTRWQYNHHFFPRRWRRNKPDPSGVHKSLRERLESTPEEEIQSIYDLALIIIDQCSSVFFDRTKPLDQRPEVMDLFASAIGGVTEHTTIAYESFWRNMEIRSMKIAQNSTSGSAKHPYLDINPEGTLLRESQDVAEELQIMLKIYNQQLHVVRDFRKVLGHMNGESKNETDEVRTLIKLLRQNSIVAGDRTQPTSQQEVTLPVPESTIQEANDLLELIRNRKAKIQDLEEAALRTTQQLQGLLSLHRRLLRHEQQGDQRITLDEPAPTNEMDVRRLYRRNRRLNLHRLFSLDPCHSYRFHQNSHHLCARVYWSQSFMEILYSRTRLFRREE
jgi:hypothetical protein